MEKLEFSWQKKKCLSLVCCAYTVIDFRVCRLDGAKGSNKISFEVLGGKRRLLNPHGGLQAQSSVQSCTQKTKSNPFNHHNFWGPQNGAGLSTRDKNWGCFYLLSKAASFFFSPIQYFHYASKTYHEKKAVWEEALENYRSSLLCLHYYCRLLAKHYFFSFHNARPTVEEKTHSFLTSTYNCKSRNLLFDFSFHYVFNLHFVGMIYIFFVWMYIYEDVMASLLQASEFLNASRKRQGVVIGWFFAPASSFFQSNIFTLFQKKCRKYENFLTFFWEDGNTWTSISLENDSSNLSL